MTTGDPIDYRVVVRRDPEDARFWLADVEGLAGGHTSSRSLATLDRYVRDVITLAADLPDSAAPNLRVEWIYQTGDPALDQATEGVRRRRAEMEAIATELAGRTGALARELVSEHRFSVREAAVLLGLSPARVDQLVQRPRQGVAG
jgi:hypothetical protein